MIWVDFENTRFVRRASSASQTTALIGFGGGLTNLYSYVGGDPVNKIDPSGFVGCTYSVSTGHLKCRSNDGKRSVDFGRGGAFSGNNNPADSGLSNTGPIPAGNYSVDPTSDPNKYNLGPAPLTRVNNYLNGGRDGFQLHPGTLSNGCVTVNPNAKDKWGQLRDMLNGDIGNSIEIGQ